MSDKNTEYIDKTEYSSGLYKFFEKFADSDWKIPIILWIIALYVFPNIEFQGKAFFFDDISITEAPLMIMIYWKHLLAFLACISFIFGLAAGKEKSAFSYTEAVLFSSMPLFIYIIVLLFAEADIGIAISCILLFIVFLIGLIITACISSLAGVGIRSFFKKE